MMTPMLVDTTSVRKVATLTLKGSIISRGFSSLIEWIERQTKGQLVYDKSIFPYRLPELSDLFQIAENLKKAGVIKHYQKTQGFPDEPQRKNWLVTCNTENDHVAGGLAVHNDRQALTAALAEATERYVWITGDVHLNTHDLPIAAARARASYIPPEAFNGFSSGQKGANPRLTINEETILSWSKAFSLTKNQYVYIPTQLVTRKAARTLQKKEPILRSAVTNGLATWPNQIGARLMGTLELIERDAFMVMWLSQRAPDKIDNAQLVAAYPELKKIFDDCLRYQLLPSVLYLKTDAPTHAVAVVLEDLTKNEPAFSIGLKAHQSLQRAVEGALLESLRARSNTRYRLTLPNAQEIRTKKVGELNHVERSIYWAQPENASKLSFLTGGKTIPVPIKEWGDEKIEEHFARISAWCTSKNYDLVSVSFTNAEKNVTPWHIEMVFIPQLHPMHQDESLPYLSELRAVEIYGKLIEGRFPVSSEPHPFV